MYVERNLTTLDSNIPVSHMLQLDQPPTTFFHICLHDVDSDTSGKRTALLSARDSIQFRALRSHTQRILPVATYFLHLLIANTLTDESSSCKIHSIDHP